MAATATKRLTSRGLRLRSLLAQRGWKAFLSSRQFRKHRSIRPATLNRADAERTIFRATYVGNDASPAFPRPYAVRPSENATYCPASDMSADGELSNGRFTERRASSRLAYSGAGSSAFTRA